MCSLASQTLSGKRPVSRALQADRSIPGSHYKRPAPTLGVAELALLGLPVGLSSLHTAVTTADGRVHLHCALYINLLYSSIRWYALDDWTN